MNKINAIFYAMNIDLITCKLAHLWKTWLRIIRRISINLLSGNVNRSRQRNSYPRYDWFAACFGLSSWNVIHVTMHVAVWRARPQIQFQVGDIGTSIGFFALLFHRVCVRCGKYNKKNVWDFSGVCIWLCDNLSGEGTASVGTWEGK